MPKTRFYLFMSLTVVLGLIAAGCARQTSTPSNQTGATTPAPHSSPAKAEATKAPADSSAPRVGEVTGSYTAKGETVTLKYAYAGRAERFGEQSVVILLTDQPIPPEAVAEEIKSQTMLLDGKIRGLEYAIMKDGYWVRYHPSQYQESKGGQLKDYSIENDIVRGSDEDKGDMTDGKYSRSVKFMASIK